MTAVGDDKLNYFAFLGNLRHKRELVLLFKAIVPAQPYFTNAHQAAYLRAHYPELVPDPQNGVPPSDHAVATVFEYNYEFSLEFRLNYLTHVRTRA
jgi:hypothetical protein